MNTDFNYEQANETEEAKIKVITALENPKFRSRTIEGVSQETQLSPKEVLEIISKLGRQVIKLRKSDKRGRSLYTTKEHFNRSKDEKKNVPSEVSINQTLDRALDQLSEAKPEEIQKIAASQIELLHGYHSLVMKQANQSFVSARIAALVGFGFFLCAIAFLLITQSQSIATVSVIGGAISGGISGINFYLYGQTTKQLAHYHRQLDQTQRFLLANSVCESLEGESKQKARSTLVSMIVTFRVEQPYTFTSEEQRNEKQQ